MIRGAGLSRNDGGTERRRRRAVQPPKPPGGYGVVVTVDQSRAVSSDIPTDGGAISATASDGSVFTLTIPPNALLSDERITMTPVSSIDGLPLSGGLAAAVSLAPAGLQLFQPAILTIVPARAVALAEEITFAWRGNGGSSSMPRTPVRGS